jgi:hypothetical protein
MRARVGRRNHYRVHHDRPMRHAIFADRQIGELLASLLPKP